jgi:hypothetical protein
VLEETGYQVSVVEPLTSYAPMSGISSQVPKLLVDDQVPDGPSMTALGYYCTTRRPIG